MEAADLKQKNAVAREKLQDGLKLLECAKALKRFSPEDLGHGLSRGDKAEFPVRILAVLQVRIVLYSLTFGTNR